MKIIMAVKKFADFPVGIIGGSDGPTAVFVTMKPKSALWILVFAAVSALGLLFWFLRKRC